MRRGFKSPSFQPPITPSNYSITRLPNNQILMALLAATVAVLAATLRPDSFSSGDSGVKLIAARAVLQDPFHPFDIRLPAIAGAPTPHVEPFFAVHGEHAHAVTSPIFPLLTAPLLAALGLHGLYVLPALGYLLSIAAIAAFATAGAERRTPVIIAATTILGVPYLYYGLEFWEHMPAVACAAWAAAAFLGKRPLTAGFLVGVAILLRPEAIWFAAALAGAALLLAPRPSMRDFARLAAGTCAVCGMYELFVVWHFGSLVPPHIAVNSGETVQHWSSIRASLLATWFGSLETTSAWVGAPCAVAAMASLALPKRSDHRFLWALALADIILTVLTAPNDGGSQWSPRYLLFAWVPLAVLAADTVDRIPRRRLVGIAVLVVACAAGFWMNRMAFRTLRGAKAVNGRIVDFVARTTSGSRDVVTDVWWIDQIAAPALGAHQVFFTPEASTGAAVVKRLSDAAVPLVHVIRSREESPDTASWRQGSCYFEERRDTTTVRGLVSIQLRHRCGAPDTGD